MIEYTIRGTEPNTKKGLVFAKAFDEPLQCAMINACQGYQAILASAQEDKKGIDYWVVLPNGEKIAVNAKMVNTKYINLDYNTIEINEFGVKEFNDYFEYSYIGAYCDNRLYIVSVEDALPLVNVSKFAGGGYYIYVHEFIRYAKYIFTTTVEMQQNYQNAHETYVKIPGDKSYQEIVDILNPIHKNILNEDFCIKVDYNL